MTKKPVIESHPSVEQGQDSLLRQIDRSIEALASLGENWNGYAVAAPNRAAIDHARKYIPVLYRATTDRGGEWQRPHVSADEEGNVVFEWWHSDRKLTLYVTPAEVSFIRIEKPCSLDTMEEGMIASPEEGARILAWLAD